MRILWNHDRNFWARRSKPRGVRRVLCMGDSMIYGSGCTPEETLPAHLEAVLNRALWGADVEVINAGVSGESIYDEWHRFLHDGHRWRPDLLLIIICGNDAELFSINAPTAQRQKITYAQHTEECWRPDGLHFPHFERVCRDIAAQVNELGLPTMIAYYEIHDSKIRADVVEKISATCAAVGLEFVDLSQDFVGASSSNQNTSVRVSAVDGHPSDEGHRIAARRLGRAIVRGGWLAGETPADERALLEHLMQTHRARLAEGYRPEYVYWRLQRILEHKRQSRTRVRMDDESLLDDAAYAEVVTGIGALRRARFVALGWEAQAYSIEAQRAHLDDLRATIAERVKLVSRSIFVLGNCLNDPALKLVSFLNGDPKAFDASRLARISDDVGGWQAAVSEASNRLEEIKRTLQGAGDGLARAALDDLDAAHDLIVEGWSELSALCQTVMSLTHYLVELIQTFGGELSPPTQRAVAGIADGIGALHSDAQELVNLLGVTHPPRGGAEAPYTTIEVTLRTEAPKTFALWVQARARSPRQPFVSDMHWVTCDGQPHQYRFEVPYFELGEVWVTLNPPRTAIIEGVRIYQRQRSNPSPLAVAGDNVWRTPLQQIVG